MASGNTTVDVRVIAAGGKFLGNDVAGAEVVLTDVSSGAVMVRGTVRGGSGNLVEIMDVPRTWGAAVPSDQASSVRFDLSLPAPRLVEVAAYGPLSSLQSAKRVSIQQWLVPGVNLQGDDAVVMVIPGLLVQVLSPATHTSLPGAGPVEILANVGMMCGCPISDAPSLPPSPTNPWPAGEFDVQAYVTQIGDEPVLVAQVPLAYAGQPSRFSGTFTVQEQEYGFYEVTVVARQRCSPNTGLDRATFFRTPPPPSDAPAVTGGS